ncbi:MAG: heme-binding protein, partial [Terriglobales bacterium]
MSPLKAVSQILCALGLALISVCAPAQSYGPNINIETAKKIAAGAVAECQSNKWNVAVAIVDTHGGLVYFERMED